MTSIFGLIQQGAASPQQDMFRLLAPLVMCIAIFYFIVMVPMRRQKKQQAQMLRDLQAGNVVVTNSGIIGTIVSIADDSMIVRVKPDNVKLQIARSAIAGLVPEEKKT